MVDVLGSVITGMKANTGIAAVVSTRIYRDVLPPLPTFPAIVASCVDDLGTGDTSQTNYAQARIQCSCYATTGKGYTAFNLSKLVKKYLHNKTNVTLNGSNLVSIVDMGAVPDSNQEVTPAIYMVHRDFMVRYRDQ
jgi:hypothetical protein